MPYPGVQINVSNGNVSRPVVGDGVGAIIATALVSGNIGVVNQVYNLKDAETKGYTAVAEPFIHQFLAEFYTELGGNQLLYVLGVADTMLMKDMVDSTNANGISKLQNAAAGAITVIGVLRKPATGYDAGTGFLDKDVQDAVLGSLPLCTALQLKNTPVRLLIEGRIANENVANTFTPNTSANGFAAVVLGATAPDCSAAVSLALARACKYGVNVKLGSGQNGPLSVTQLYVGTKTIEERIDIETLHDAGFMTFQVRPGAAGYYFGVDNMCSTDDFKILAHGRTIDKAQRIAAAAYLPNIETDIAIDADGSPKDIDCIALEKQGEQSVLANMGNQISGVKVTIDPTQGAGGNSIITTSTLNAELAIQPKGYLTWIRINMGLTAQITQ